MSWSETLDLSTRLVGSVRVIGVRMDCLDVRRASRLDGDFRSLVRDHRAVVIDLSDVGYVDRFGFELLLRAVRACPGKVRFGGVRPEVELLFELASLDVALRPCRTLESALEDFRD